MPSIVLLVDYLSIELNRCLVDVGLPPLTEGKIVIGKAALNETPAPPRVVLVPKAFRFEDPEAPTVNLPARSAPLGAGLTSILVGVTGSGYTSPTITIGPPQLPGGIQATAVPVVVNGSIRAVALTNAGIGYTEPPNVTIADTTGQGATATSVLGPTAETVSRLSLRPLYTEIVSFECHVWGAASPQDYVQDFDAAQWLHQQLIASAYRIAPDQVDPTPGIWADARPGAADLAVTGHYVIFGLEFRTPVLDRPLLFAPLGVQSTGVISASTTGGTPQPA